MNDDIFHLAIRNIRPHLHCDGALADGINRVASQLTSAHSLTAKQRKNSVWRLVRVELNAPYQRLIDACDIGVARALLPAELASIGHQLPKFKPNVSAWIDATRIDLKLDDWFEDAKASSYSPAIADVDLNPCQLLTPVLVRIEGRQQAGIEQMERNLDLWDENFRFAIRALTGTTGGAGSSLARNVLRASFDSLRSLLAVLRLFRPQSSSSIGKYGRRLYVSSTNEAPSSFCELCWRETLSVTAKKLGEIQYGDHLKRKTNRFCEMHDPSRPRSAYRKDLRYKEAFQRELKALRGLCASRYLVGFTPPHSPDEQEVRKTAFDLVHSRIHTLVQDYKNEPSFREKVWVLLREGRTQSEIAKLLGVHRQSVSRAAGVIERTIEDRLKKECIDPGTGEVNSAAQFRVQRRKRLLALVS